MNRRSGYCAEGDSHVVKEKRCDSYIFPVRPGTHGDLYKGFRNIAPKIIIQKMATSLFAKGWKTLNTVCGIILEAEILH
jgi:hypothetical protein